MGFDVKDGSEGEPLEGTGDAEETGISMSLAKLSTLVGSVASSRMIGISSTESSEGRSAEEEREGVEAGERGALSGTAPPRMPMGLLGLGTSLMTLSEEVEAESRGLWEGLVGSSPVETRRWAEESWGGVLINTDAIILGDASSLSFCSKGQLEREMRLCWGPSRVRRSRLGRLNLTGFAKECRNRSLLSL